MEKWRLIVGRGVTKGGPYPATKVHAGKLIPRAQLGEAKAGWEVPGGGKADLARVGLAGKRKKTKKKKKKKKKKKRTKKKKIKKEKKKREQIIGPFKKLL